MVLYKAGYLVAALAAVVVAMPPESPAPAAFRSTDLQQEETKGLPQFGSRNAYPTQENSNYPVSNDPSYSERNQEFGLQREPGQEIGQRFNPQRDETYGQVQSNSVQRDFRQNANIDQRNYREQSLENQETQFQKQNYESNPNQNLNQDLTESQQYSQRQGSRDQFSDQRTELNQEVGKADSFSSGSFQNQRTQNQFTGTSLSGVSGPGAVPASAENSGNQDFQRSNTRYRGSQRYDDGLNSQEDPNIGNYQYSYDIRSEDTGDMKFHKESRDGNKVIGEYRVKEADGSMRIVKYTADAENGFQATVEYVMEDEEPTEFGAKMVPKTTRPKNQRNFGNRRVYEPSRSTQNQGLVSRDRVRPDNIPRSENTEDMSLFLNSPTSQGQQRPRPGFVGDNREFQQPSNSRFDESFQENSKYPQDSSRDFSRNFQGPEFQNQKNVERQFSKDARSQPQASNEFSLQGQNRRPFPFQGRDQIQTQTNNRRQNQNRNQERYNYENQEREQFQNRNRNEFQGDNRPQLQSNGRYQFDNQEPSQFQNDGRKSFSSQNRNNFLNQDRNQFQNSEIEQRRESQFQSQNINPTQRQGSNAFQIQNQNPYQEQILNQGRQQFNDQDRISSQFQGNSFQNQEGQSPLNNERNNFRTQYPDETNNQYQQHRNQYNLQESDQFPENFDTQRNEQFNNQRRIQSQPQIRQQLRTHGGNNFENQAENRPVQQYNDRFQTQSNEFQDFNENQYSRQRESEFPSNSLNQFQSQNRRPFNTRREQFREASPTGSQNQFNEQHPSQFSGQNTVQYQKQQNSFDGPHSSDQTQSKGQRYGVDSQNNQFQGEGVYHEMNDKRYENQRYGQDMDDHDDLSTFNQAGNAQGDLYDHRDEDRLRNFDNEFVDISRQNQNYQSEEQFSRNHQNQGRLPSHIAASSGNEFQDQFHPAGLVGQQATHQFRNENFSQASSQESRQNPRLGSQPNQEQFRPSQVTSGAPQSSVRHQRFETNVESHSRT